MPTCRHGTFTQRGRGFTSSEQATSDSVEGKHRRKTGCSATVFAHPGHWLGIFGVLCCEKHGELTGWL